MSHHKFCSQCGAKMEYKFAAPKFCSSCGASLSRGAETTISNSFVPADTGEETEEGVTNSTKVPDIQRLDAAVDFESNVMTFGFDNNKGFSFGEKKFEKRSTSF